MVRAKTTTPTIKGIAVRFTNWIGGTIAKPESTMTTPAMGDIVRPIWPEIRAIAPRFGIGIPKEAACGVTASLKAKVAASPEPVMAAMMNGPKDPPQRAISLELFKTSTKASIHPVALKPAAKTPAVMMIPMTEP